MLKHNNFEVDEMIEKMKERLFVIYADGLKANSIHLIVRKKKDKDFLQTKKDCFLEMFLFSPSLFIIFFFEVRFYKDVLLPLF